jgi:hypothetical protein
VFSFVCSNTATYRTPRPKLAIFLQQNVVHEPIDVFCYPDQGVFVPNEPQRVQSNRDNQPSQISYTRRHVLLPMILRRNVQVQLLERVKDPVALFTKEFVHIATM